MGIRLRALLAGTALAASGFAFISGTPPAGAIPSDDYCPATPVFDGTIAGVYTKAAVYTGTPTAVCFRLGDPGVFGGALVIGSPSAGIPTTDGNLDACTVRIIDGDVLGTPVMVGLGFAASEVSVCLEVDATAMRIVIPVGVSPAINFYPDSGGGGGGGVVPWPSEGCPSTRGPVITIPVICVQYTPPIP